MTIVFTGHMIDLPDRREPRFPPEKEPAVALTIAKILSRAKRIHGGVLNGIAGAACGADIIFHEQCRKARIGSEIYLPLPVGAFKQESVAFAGPAWERRFDELISVLPVHVMARETLGFNGQNIWEQANEWILDRALQSARGQTCLAALWNGEAGDKSGGTDHLIKLARERKITVDIIDINHL